MLGICRRTVYAEIEKGRLSSYKVGARRLISKGAIEDWLNEREAEAKAEAVAQRETG